MRKRPLKNRFETETKQVQEFVEKMSNWIFCILLAPPPPPSFSDDKAGGSRARVGQKAYKPKISVRGYGSPNFLLRARQNFVSIKIYVVPHIF